MATIAMVATSASAARKNKRRGVRVGRSCGRVAVIAAGFEVLGVGARGAGNGVGVARKFGLGVNVLGAGVPAAFAGKGVGTANGPIGIPIDCEARGASGAGATSIPCARRISSIVR